MALLPEEEWSQELQRTLQPLRQELQAELPGQGDCMSEVLVQAGCRRGDVGLNEKEKNVAYAQLPKPLIEAPLSNDAKLLFTLLNDRFRLSLKTDFTDDDGYPYCSYSNREICKKLNCAHGKATGLLRELEQAGLIYRIRTGRGKPDRIYVGGIQEDDGDESECRLSAIMNADFQHSRMPMNSTPECRYSAPSKNNSSNKDFSAISQKERKEQCSALFERLKLNSLFTEERESGLRQLRWHIVTVMETEFPFLRLAGKDYPTEEIRSAFYQLKKEDLEEILADFLADPAAFGSMRERLFSAGQKRRIGDGGLSSAVRDTA